MESFEQLKALVLHYLRATWKNRWLAIIVAWVVFVSGVVFVDQIKDKYTAETKVYIDTTSVLRPLLKGLAVETDIQSNIQLMVRKLLSRPNLERAIRMMDMDINTQSLLEMEILIENIKSRVSIATKSASRGQISNIYTITYEDESPQVAKRMVQTLLDIFMEDALGKSASESDSAIAFLDKQIAKYETFLEESELKLEQFKRKNVGVMPEDGDNYFQRLQLLNTQHEQSLLLQREAINRRDKLKAQLQNLSVEKAVDTTASKYDQRIASLETDLEDLLLNYTEAHPDVTNTKRIIESLKIKRDDELSIISEDTAPFSKLDNPVYQELQVLLSETEANIASLNARVISHKQKADKLKKLVDIIPGIESEFIKLTRDYNVYKANYEALVSRREQAKISDDVGSGSEQIKFRVIEPPRVPSSASFPNRPLFDVGVLIIALGAGYGLGLLISLTKPVFYNVSELREYTGLAVLGGVIKFDTDEVLSKRKRNVYLFIMANLLLMGVAALAVFLHSQSYVLLSSIKSNIFSLL